MPSAIVFIITEEIQFLITNIYAFILEEDKKKFIFIKES